MKPVSSGSSPHIIIAASGSQVDRKPSSAPRPSSAVTSVIQPFGAGRGVLRPRPGEVHSQEIPRRKLNVYLPEKRRALNKNDFNCKISWDDSQMDDELEDNMVACEYLSVEYLRLGGKNFLNISKELDSLKSHFIDNKDSNRITSKFFRGVRSLPEKNKTVLDNESFGAFLSDVASAMLDQGKPRARICLQNVSHAVAVEMKRKDNPDRFTVAFFDPNATSVHTRVEAARADELRKITMDHAYSATRLCDDTSAMPTTCTAFSLDVELKSGAADRYLNDDSEKSLSSALFCATADGQPEIMKAVYKRLIQYMPKEEALAKLNVASSALGTARANAMQNGHSTSLIALKEILKMAGVEGKDATQWLDTSGEPVSALLKAVVKGHAETIATYGTVLKALKVPKADAMRLLDARTSDGETAAFAAVAYGRPDSLEAYAQLLLGSGIKGQEAKPFMSLHSNDGVQADKITPKHSLRSVMQALNRSLPLLHLTMADVV